MNHIYQFVFEKVLQEKLDKQIGAQLIKMLNDESENTKQEKDIAIIGMSVHMSMAANVDEFWHNVKTGTDCITSVPTSRLEEIRQFFPYFGDHEQLEYGIGSYLDRIGCFDHSFFRISPAEANMMDPNQRLFLQAAWNALEDAGYTRKTVVGNKIGVYVGHSSDFGIEYKRIVSQANDSGVDLSVAGNLKAIIASRISYLLDLKGPSMLIDTACSSSLVAVHVASKSLRSGECEMALVGGIKVNLLPLTSRSGIGIDSQDGRARAFDDSSDGTGFGEGIVALLLKPLDKAKADKDQIHAVIKGSAINQDGTSVGITAPNLLAQEEVIVNAWKDAGIDDPDTITYIEAHGTGTPLGDPIELNGIEGAFRRFSNKKQFCAIGSVKSNVGHLDHNAGLAGLVKAVLALKNKQLPPSLHIRRPNRKFRFEDAAVYLNDKLTDWVSPDSPRRCGVSSFGLSGTNCHVVLEESPDTAVRTTDVNVSKPMVFTLSAKNHDSLLAYVQSYKETLEGKPELRIDDICYTAAVMRDHYNCRVALVLTDRQDFIRKIDWLIQFGMKTDQDRGIYVSEGTTSDIKNQWNLEAQSLIRKATTTDPDYFSTLHELCKMYIRNVDIDWEPLYQNVQPSKVSLPTYPFQKKTCWVDARVPEVNSAEVTNLIHPLLHQRLADSLNMVIYSTHMNVGDHAAFHDFSIEGQSFFTVTALLEMARHAVCHHLSVSTPELRAVTIHQPLILQWGFEQEVQTLLKQTSDSLEFTIISRNDKAEEWTVHADGKAYRSKKQSAKHVRTFQGEQTRVMSLQLPHPYAENCLQSSMMQTTVMTDETEAYSVAIPVTIQRVSFYEPMPLRLTRFAHFTNQENSLVTGDLVFLNDQERIVAEVEGYTFQRMNKSAILQVAMSQHQTAFHEICWKPEPLAGTTGVTPCTILFLHGEGERSAHLLADLKKNGHEIIEVQPGKGFYLTPDGTYFIGDKEEDYLALFDAVREQGFTRIVHALTVEIEAREEQGFFSMFHLIRALSQSKIRGKMHIDIISTCANEVDGEEAAIHPEHAALFGLAKVIPQEHSNITCRCVDIDTETPSDMLIHELHHHSSDLVVGFRNGTRYVQECRTLDMNAQPSHDMKLRSQGVYLITGGLGGVSLEIAKYMATRESVNLCLLGRSSLPPQTEWNNILQTCSDQNQKTVKRIKALQAIQELGSKVEYFQADVSKEEDLQVVLKDIRSKYGRIDGVIHAAGIAGDGMMQRKDRETFERVLAPKIRGTRLLDHLTQADQPDFFILFSSVTSLLGGFGQSDYTTANAYLDAYAAHRTKRGHFTTTINWATWKETGMAVDYGVHELKSAFRPLSTAKAIQAFDQIFARKVMRIIVGDLDEEVLAQVDSVPFALSDSLHQRLERRKIPSSETTHGQTPLRIVRLLGKADDTYTLYEKQFGEIWGNVLGMDEISIYDDFYELGGDSIIAMKIVNTINDSLSLDVSIPDLFEHLTVAALAEHVSQKAVPQVADTELAPIAAADISDNEEEEFTSALSRGQERIWFLQQLEPAMTAYNLPITADLQMQVELPMLQKALNALIKCHRSLRTIFVTENGVPRQKVLHHISVPIELVDLRDLLNQGELLDQMVRTQKQRSFDLSQPMIRVALYQLGETHYHFFCNVHHIIVDGWSMDLFYQELMRLYNSYVRGDNQQPAQPKRSYAEWVEQQREWEQTNEYKQMEEYFLNEFSGILPVLQLPTDFQRPPLQTYNGSYVKFNINREQTMLLKEVAKSLHATTHMTLLASYFLFLHKLTRDNDLIIGFPISGREKKEWEDVIGLFINMLCIRVNMEGIETFADLVKYVREKSLQSYKNGRYPFDSLVAALHPERDLSRSPIFSTMFQFYEVVTPDNDGATQYELSLLVTEQQGEMAVKLEYNTDLFRPDTIQRFALQFLNLIGQITENHRQSLSDLTLLSTEEKDFLLTANSQTDANCLGSETIHELFIRQAKQTPDAIAVQGNNVTWTYRELDRASNQLARLLQKEGVQANTPVGIMIGRHPHMLIAILGALKAGGCYVPLDPEYPTERLVYILEHSGARVLITEGQLATKVQAILLHRPTVETVIDLNPVATLPHDWEGIQRSYELSDILQEQSDELPARSGKYDLSYIMYTSGSTGLPKGVMVTHNNVSNFIKWSIKEHGLTPADNMILVTSYSFDISVFEMMGALCSGARLHIATMDALKDTNLLLEWIEQKGITVWHSVPTMMAQLLISLKNKTEKATLRSLRTIMLGGEAWSVELAKGIRAACPNASIKNMYGPTEATIWATCYTINEELDQLTSLPIGKPVANNRLLLLDSEMNLCAVGMIGEICITGCSITKGYYRDEDKTKLAFLAGKDGEIIYRTGDKGRYLPSGEIQFLGREDHLIKVRGYRIEAGEIESIVLTDERIQQVAVVAQSWQEAQRLICFYTSQEELDGDDLRVLLEVKVPEYMIPSLWIRLEKMPLTPNGKIYRQALERMDTSVHLKQTTISQEPISETEEFLADIWNKLLGIQQYGRHDSFFNLGGTSFMVTQMHAQIDHVYPDKISILDIFKNPTIAKLSQLLLESDDQPSQARVNVPIENTEDVIMNLIDRAGNGELSLDDLMNQLDKLEVE
ncbi:amino acid adenylation domain-containing protein [Brevibacillus antibioticus]|uniref:Amino acid adenylation domain-containing protein n=1 Tax=Brevibacillus antibioticus TaxID=2570228 RepID=A0A4U2Y3P7_9BACL|nr:non-ribosomal peptide synthetase [Brevibacillus antibioticus]TKI55078.1 amino acid adenylation domain-containing protein [Brevibacillus antibioticus]